MKVKFLIAGAQKSGTSALNKYLKVHPKLCIAKKKELHFFDDETIFAGRPVDYNRYHSFFSPRPLQYLCGEATPNYMYWYNAPRRIWEYNPAMKLIIILRNPIDRAFSAWNMERFRKREFLSFQEAIRAESQRVKEVLPLQHRVYAYVDRGFYTEQLRRIWHYFPKEQTLFLKSEHLKNDPQTTLNQVCDFLGVTKMPDIKPHIVNAKSYVTSMADADRAYLKELYEFEIKELEHMLDWDCSEWLAR
ncbi:MAG: sulfotransferase domain-containing protein [Anaerolineae bacterium]|nr:sulfotransferase domain-containing protein [Anaerolineae bacterium]